VLAKGKQFLLLIRHPPGYSYIQSSPVKVLELIEERKHLKFVSDAQHVSGFPGYSGLLH